MVIPGKKPFSSNVPKRAEPPVGDPFIIHAGKNMQRRKETQSPSRPPVGDPFIVHAGKNMPRKQKSKWPQK